MLEVTRQTKSIEIGEYIYVASRKKELSYQNTNFFGDLFKSIDYLAFRCSFIFKYSYE